jgi:hypothetical protein
MHQQFTVELAAGAASKTSQSKESSDNRENITKVREISRERLEEIADLSFDARFEQTTLDLSRLELSTLCRRRRESSSEHRLQSTVRIPVKAEN